MRTFRVSDQMYEQLKSFIVDPFDDTPELVIGRLIEIVNKAKARWAPFEAPEAIPEAEPPAKPRRKEKEQEVHEEEESTVVL
jgi:hypothetical protein